MSFFDVLLENQITVESGYIRKEMDEWLEGMQLGDRLRYALAFEESEYYEVFTEEMRKELLFKIFKHLALGGGICQFEDEVTPYFSATQRLYKDLVSVYKDGESGQIKISSHAFQILDLEHDDHEQSWFYVVIDPAHWHVNVWYHRFKPVF